MTQSRTLEIGTLDTYRYQKSKDSVWKTGFCDVDQVFAVQGIVHTPKNNRVELHYQWRPHEPTRAQHNAINPESLSLAMLSIALRAQIYCYVVHGYVAQDVKGGA